jgi:hypothetical protein
MLDLIVRQKDFFNGFYFYYHYMADFFVST